MLSDLVDAYRMSGEFVALMEKYSREGVYFSAAPDKYRNFESE